MRIGICHGSSEQQQLLDVGCGLWIFGIMNKQPSSRQLIGLLRVDVTH